MHVSPSRFWEYPMTPQFIEPTADSRRKFAMLWVAALVVGLAVIELLEIQSDRVKTQPICESLTMFSLWCALVFGGLALCGLWAASMGHRSLKLGQWPLPGTWVLRRTPIHRGASAKWRAYAIFAWGIVAIGGAGFSWYIAWDLGDRAASHCATPITSRPS